jgi:predicted MPP superfamily phosphohydrolase
MKKRHWIPIAIAGAALITYATLIEPRWLQVRKQRVYARSLPHVFNGLRIALLTDLHVGRGTPLSLIERAAALAMHERPDLIALTGDFTTDTARSFDHVFRALSALTAPLGVYAVPGNHDHVVGIEKWQSALRQQHNIRDLTNAYVLHERLGARLCVAGIDDIYEGMPKLHLPPLSARDFTILLAHSPDQAERTRRETDGVDLILSGHTHGGQVQLPALGPPLNSSGYPDLYVEGLRRRPWTQVYTSRGIGTVGLPVRFLARPEVTLLELSNAPRPRWPNAQAAYLRRVSV